MTRRALPVAVSLFVCVGAADLSAQTCSSDDALVFTEPDPPTNGAIVQYVDVPAGCRSVLVKIWGGGGNRYLGLGAAGGGGGAVVARISGLVGGTQDPSRRLRIHIAPRWNNYAFGGPAATVGRPLPGNIPPSQFEPLVIAGGGGAGGSLGPLAVGVPGAGGPGGGPGLLGEPAFAPNGATALGGGGATGGSGGAGGVGANNCVGYPGGPFQPYASSQNAGGAGGGGVGGDGGDGWFGGGGGGCLGNASQSFGAGGGGGSNQILKDAVYKVVGIESATGAGREPARRDDPERSLPLEGQPACPDCGYGVNAGASPTSMRYGGKARIVLRFDGLEILSATTRWKPQRDPTKDIQVRFAGPPDLDPSSVFLTVQTPTGGPAEYEPITEPVTKVPGTTDEYTFKWKGPWTFTESGQEKPMPRGNYTLSLSGRPIDSDMQITSGPYDRVSLVEVTQLSLEAMPDTPGTEANSGPGGGLAIFPDAVVWGGSVGDRGKLRVVAVTEPVITDLAGQAPVTVHFGGFDVDDPSADTGPVDADGDTGPDVNDNRVDPRSGLLRDSSGGEVAGNTLVEIATEGASARTVFRATPVVESGLQGDNHRVAASTSRPWLTELKAFQPSDDGEIRHVSGRPLYADERAQVSPMVTVWRTLHLELDTLDSEEVTQATFDLTGTSTQLEPQKLKVAQDTFVVPDSDHRYEDDWEAAKLWIGAGPVPPAFDVWKNRAKELEVRPTANLCAALPGCPPEIFFRLRDDDWADLTWELPVDLLQVLLKRVYVRAVVWDGNGTKVHAFRRNLESSALGAIPREQLNSPNYWAIPVIQGFDANVGLILPQSPRTGDNDPNAEEGGTLGQTFTSNPQPNPSQPVCAVHVETISDTSRERSYTASNIVARVTAHEVICHALYLGHVPNTLCQGDYNDGPAGEILSDALLAQLRNLPAPYLNPGIAESSATTAWPVRPGLSNSTLQIQLTPAAASLRVGDPLVLSVRYQGVMALHLDELSSENQHFRVLIDRGAGFKPYRPFAFGSSWLDPSKKPLDNMQTTQDYLLAYDREAPGWLFASPGTYRVVVEYQDDEVGTVRSNVATVTVAAPTGAEAQVFRRLQSVDPVLLALVDPGPVHPDLLPVVAEHPSSGYLHRTRLNDLLYRMLMASDAFDPDDPTARRPADPETRARMARELRLRLLETARHLAGISSQFTPDALDLLAQLQEDAGDVEGARESLRRLVGEYPYRSVAVRARKTLATFEGVDGTGVRE